MKMKNLAIFFKPSVIFLTGVTAFLLFSSFMSRAAESRQIVDRVVAVVNDDIILLSDLDEAINPYLMKLGNYSYTQEEKEKLFFKLREDVLNQLINEKLTDQQVKKSQIEVSDEEIDAAVERMKQANRLTDENLRAALEADGISIAELREKLREQILRTKLVNLEVKSKIVITQEDVEACYIREGEKYCETKKYHLRSILMRPSSDSEKKATEEKIRAIHQRLEQGEDFGELARMYSHPSLAPSGGYLGAFEEETLAPAIREAVSKLKAGEFSQVLDTDQGYQIFFVDKIETKQGKTLDEAAPEIEDRLYREIVDERFGSWLEELREKSHIKIIR